MPLERGRSLASHGFYVPQSRTEAGRLEVLRRHGTGRSQSPRGSGWVGPEVRAALSRTTALLEFEEFIKEPGGGISLVEAGETCLCQKPYARVWLCRNRAIEHSLTPNTVAPLCSDFLSPMWMRIERLKLSEVRQSAILFWRSDCRAEAQRRMRFAESSVTGLAQECGPRTRD